MNIQTLILAGGKGKRLRGVVKDAPKPMALISNLPFLEYQIIFLKKQGFKDIILCTGHLSSRIKKYFGEGKQLGVNISYSEEKEALGTAGAIKNAEKLIKNKNLLVLNGDTLFNIDLKKIVKFHQRNTGLTTIALKEVDDSSQSGVIEINKDNKIVSFKEKIKKKNVLINGGVYVFNKKIIKHIPVNKTSSLEKDIFPSLATKRQLRGVPFSDYLIDIGLPEMYKKAQTELPKIFNHKHEVS